MISSIEYNLFTKIYINIFINFFICIIVMENIKYHKKYIEIIWNEKNMKLKKTKLGEIII